MAHESFEDKEIADILNKYFVSIKVDREERPDIDSIYMSVCQAFTGSGGWPTSIFMSADQKPFFAGTYFPKTSRHGGVGLKELLLAVHKQWTNDRERLLDSAEGVISALDKTESHAPGEDYTGLIDTGLDLLRQRFDPKFGGFGDSPKFPSPHILIFLMSCYKKSGDSDLLEMAEKTLLQMYSGGLFDHIGYGFSRYSTDRQFLVPHFEKMLYDNALLVLAYCMAYDVTKKPFYKDVAEKTAFYVLNEMISPDGAFFSAQDADSDGEEGKYYLFEPDEIINLLGKKDGTDFNKYFGITKQGNFEGKSIPNLLHNLSPSDRFDSCLQKIRDYRRSRTSLHTDDKILTSWNSLMIAALCWLYRISRNPDYLEKAKIAQRFIESKMCNGDDLFVSYRDGKRGNYGFIDEYAYYIFALLALYDATLEPSFLNRAEEMSKKVISQFFDYKDGGFYLYGQDQEALILRPKESYDGAMPSGNSVMTYNLVRLQYLLKDGTWEKVLEKQLNFMCGEAEKYSAGYVMFLKALSDYYAPQQMIKVVAKNESDIQPLPLITGLESIIVILNEPTKEYPILNDKTTFYVCRDNSCLPATNDISILSEG